MEDDFWGFKRLSHRGNEKDLARESIMETKTYDSGLSFQRKK